VAFDPDCGGAGADFPVAGDPHPVTVLINPIAFYPYVLGAGSDSDDFAPWCRGFGGDDDIARRNRCNWFMDNNYPLVMAHTTAKQQHSQ
jgi:hypothetical protein